MGSHKDVKDPDEDAAQSAVHWFSYVGLGAMHLKKGLYSWSKATVGQKYGLPLCTADWLLVGNEGMEEHKETIVFC